MYKFILRMLGVKEDVRVRTSAVTSFPQLDLDRIAKEVDLLAEAKMRGRKDLPASDSEAYDIVETKIIDIFEEEKKGAIELLERHLNIQNNEINESGFDELIARLKDMPGKAIAELKAIIKVGEGEVWRLKRDYSALDNAMEDFRIVNKLKTPASYPDSKLLQWGIIVFIFILETSANGLFLSEGHDFGLTGGVGEAFVISIVNIGSGYIIGSMVIPYVNHIDSSNRRISFTVTVIYLIALVIFNLAVAHYRDVMGNQLVDNPGNLAFQKFIENPFLLEDIKSFWLLCVGILFATIAMIDGYRMDDKYPGYGKLDKKLKEAQDDYIEYLGELLDDLNLTKDKYIKYIDVISKDLSIKQININGISNRRINLEATFNSHIQYLEDCCNSRLNLYRSTNIESRDSKGPEYFSKKWSFDEYPDAAAIINGDGFSVDANLKKSIDDAIGSTSKLKKQIYSTHEAMMNIYVGLEGL